MNLKGGYKIIDLLAISVVLGSNVAITDKGVLDQLLSLKDYLDETKQLKPILLRVGNSSDKETIMGALRKPLGEDKIYIMAHLSDSNLLIEVEFKQDEETEEYYIDKAVYTKEVATKINVTDIENMSDADLDALKCGDIVTKQTGNQKHAYMVTYKEEKHGICLSYFDGSGYLETISYDYSTDHWVFNSKDVCNILGAEEGTIDKVLGLDASGKLVKGAVSGGTKLYKHVVKFNDNHTLTFICPNESELTTLADLYNAINLLGVCLLNFYDDTGHANYYLPYNGNSFNASVSDNLLSIFNGRLSYIGSAFMFTITQIVQQADNTYVSTNYTRMLTSISEDTVTEL